MTTMNIGVEWNIDS